jgi:hypothetical protein
LATALTLAHLAGRQPEHEAGQDGAVDLARAPGVGAQHLGRAVAPGARHAQLDVAQLAQQMPPVMAVAPVRLVVHAETIEPGMHDLVHTPFDDRGQCLAAERAIALAPLEPVGLHRLHHRKRLR